MGCDSRFAFCRAVKQLGVASRDETYGRVVDDDCNDGGKGRAKRHGLWASVIHTHKSWTMKRDRGRGLRQQIGMDSSTLE